LRDDPHRIRHDAHQVRRIDDVERVVREDEVRSIHFLQPNMTQSLTPDALARLLQHRRRQVDASDRTGCRVKRRVDAGTDAYLEDAITWLDPHPLDRHEAAMMQARTKNDVINLGQLFVDAVDEGIFDGSD